MSAIDESVLSTAAVAQSLEQQEQELELLQQQLEEQESLQQKQHELMLAEQQEMQLQLKQDDMSRDSIPGDFKMETETNGVKRPASTSDEEPAVKKRASEIEQYWKVVNEKPNDFNSWTMLLQRIDQSADHDMAHTAYSAFFKRYPYCYGYWKKYADLEKRKGSRTSTVKIFKQGIEMIPLSVDLWCHYMDYVITEYADQEQLVRQEFQEAIKSCGLEFKSEKIWDAYINWENNESKLKNVTKIYEKLLALPVSKYQDNWAKFNQHVKKHPPNEVISSEEFLELRKQVQVELNRTETNDPDEAPPGEEATLTAEQITLDEEEIKAIRKHIITSRQTKYFDKGSSAAKARWSYEESIKRPYFHVKPLEKSQLSAWRSYLEFEIKQGDLERIKTLFERCLIACALYEEFWMRYIRYLEDHQGTEDDLRKVYEKACTVHLPEKYRPHLSWAAFEEEKNNQDKALEILKSVQKRMPLALEAYTQAIGVERRRGNLGNAETIFKSTLNMLKDKEEKIFYGQMVIKYARFLTLFKNDPESSVTSLESALNDDKMNTGLILSLVDHMLACRPPKLEKSAQLLKSCTSSAFPPTTRLMFAHRYMHFNTECGYSNTSAGDGLRLLREVQHDVRQMEAEVEEQKKKETKEVVPAQTPVPEKKRSQPPPQAPVIPEKNNYPPPHQPNMNGAPNNQMPPQNYPNYQQENYGGYNQQYPQWQGGWQYPPNPNQQSGYGFNQGWNYNNYYGQQR